MPTLPSDKKILRPSPSLIKLKEIITIPIPHLLFQIHIPAYSSKFTSPPTPPDSPPRLLLQIPPPAYSSRITSPTIGSS